MERATASRFSERMYTASGPRPTGAPGRQTNAAVGATVGALPPQPNPPIRPRTGMPPRMPNAQRRAPRTAWSIGTRYVLGLTYAQLITAVEVAAVAISLGGQSFGANTALTPPRLAVPVALIA